MSLQIDVSYLTPQERETILVVLKRDEIIRNADETRVKRVRRKSQSASYREKLRSRIFTGEWFDQLTAPGRRVIKNVSAALQKVITIRTTTVTTTEMIIRDPASARGADADAETGPETTTWTTDVSRDESRALNYESHSTTRTDSAVAVAADGNRNTREIIRETERTVTVDETHPRHDHTTEDLHVAGGDARRSRPHPETASASVRVNSRRRDEDSIRAHLESHGRRPTGSELSKIQQSFNNGCQSQATASCPSERTANENNGITTVCGGDGNVTVVPDNNQITQHSCMSPIDNEDDLIDVGTDEIVGPNFEKKHTKEDIVDWMSTDLAAAMKNVTATKRARQSQSVSEEIVIPINVPSLHESPKQNEIDVEKVKGELSSRISDTLKQLKTCDAIDSDTSNLGSVACEPLVIPVKRYDKDVPSQYSRDMALLEKDNEVKRNLIGKDHHNTDTSTAVTDDSTETGCGFDIRPVRYSEKDCHQIQPDTEDIVIPANASSFEEAARQSMVDVQKAIEDLSSRTCDSSKETCDAFDSQSSGTELVTVCFEPHIVPVDITDGISSHNATFKTSRQGIDNEIEGNLNEQSHEIADTSTFPVVNATAEMHIELGAEQEKHSQRESPTKAAALYYAFQTSNTENSHHATETISVEVHAKVGNVVEAHCTGTSSNQNVSLDKSSVTKLECSSVETSKVDEDVTEHLDLPESKLDQLSSASDDSLAGDDKMSLLQFLASLPSIEPIHSPARHTSPVALPAKMSRQISMDSITINDAVEESIEKADYDETCVRQSNITECSSAKSILHGKFESSETMSLVERESCHKNKPMVDERESIPTLVNLERNVIEKEVDDIISTHKENIKEFDDKSSIDVKEEEEIITHTNVNDMVISKDVTANQEEGNHEISAVEQEIYQHNESDWKDAEILRNQTLKDVSPSKVCTNEHSPRNSEIAVTKSDDAACVYQPPLQNDQSRWNTHPEMEKPIQSDFHATELQADHLQKSEVTSEVSAPVVHVCVQSPEHSATFVSKSNNAAYVNSASNQYSEIIESEAAMDNRESAFIQNEESDQNLTLCENNEVRHETELLNNNQLISTSSTAALAISNDSPTVQDLDEIAETVAIGGKLAEYLPTEGRHEITNTEVHLDSDSSDASGTPFELADIASSNSSVCSNDSSNEKTSYKKFSDIVTATDIEASSQPACSAGIADGRLRIPTISVTDYDEEITEMTLAEFVEENETWDSDLYISDADEIEYHRESSYSLNNASGDSDTSGDHSADQDSIDSDVIVASEFYSIPESEDNSIDANIQHPDRYASGLELLEDTAIVAVGEKSSEVVESSSANNSVDVTFDHSGITDYTVTSQYTTDNYNVDPIKTTFEDMERKDVFSEVDETHYISYVDEVGEIEIYNDAATSIAESHVSPTHNLYPIIEESEQEDYLDSENSSTHSRDASDIEQSVVRSDMNQNQDQDQSIVDTSVETSKSDIFINLSGHNEQLTDSTVSVAAVPSKKFDDATSLSIADPQLHDLLYYIDGDVGSYDSVILRSPSKEEGYSEEQSAVTTTTEDLESSTEDKNQVKAISMQPPYSSGEMIPNESAVEDPHRLSNVHMSDELAKHIAHDPVVDITEATPTQSSASEELVQVDISSMKMISEQVSLNEMPIVVDNETGIAILPTETNPSDSDAKELMNTEISGVDSSSAHSIFGAKYPELPCANVSNIQSSSGDEHDETCNKASIVNLDPSKALNEPDVIDVKMEEQQMADNALDHSAQRSFKELGDIAEPIERVAAVDDKIILQDTITSESAITDENEIDNTTTPKTFKRSSKRQSVRRKTGKSSENETDSSKKKKLVKVRKLHKTKQEKEACCVESSDTCTTISIGTELDEQDHAEHNDEFSTHETTLPDSSQDLQSDKACANVIIEQEKNKSAFSSQNVTNEKPPEVSICQMSLPDIKADMSVDLSLEELITIDKSSSGSTKLEDSVASGENIEPEYEFTVEPPTVPTHLKELIDDQQLFIISPTEEVGTDVKNDIPDEDCRIKTLADSVTSSEILGKSTDNNEFADDKEPFATYASDHTGATENLSCEESIEKVTLYDICDPTVGNLSVNMSTEMQIATTETLAMEQFIETEVPAETESKECNVDDGGIYPVDESPGKLGDGDLKSGFTKSTDMYNMDKLENADSLYNTNETSESNQGDEIALTFEEDISTKADSFEMHVDMSLGTSADRTDSDVCSIDPTLPDAGLSAEHVEDISREEQPEFITDESINTTNMNLLSSLTEKSTIDNHEEQSHEEDTSTVTKPEAVALDDAIVAQNDIITKMVGTVSEENVQLQNYDNTETPTALFSEDQVLNAKENTTITDKITKRIDKNVAAEYPDDTTSENQAFQLQSPDNDFDIGIEKVEGSLAAQISSYEARNDTELNKIKELTKSEDTAMEKASDSTFEHLLSVKADQENCKAEEQPGIDSKQLIDTSFRGEILKKTAGNNHKSLDETKKTSNEMGKHVFAEGVDEKLSLETAEPILYEETSTSSKESGEVNVVGSEALCADVVKEESGHVGRESPTGDLCGNRIRSEQNNVGSEEIEESQTKNFTVSTITTPKPTGDATIMYAEADTTPEPVDMLSMDFVLEVKSAANSDVEPLLSRSVEEMKNVVSITNELPVKTTDNHQHVEESCTTELSEEEPMELLSTHASKLLETNNGNTTIDDLTSEERNDISVTQSSPSIVKNTARRRTIKKKGTKPGESTTDASKKSTKKKVVKIIQKPTTSDHESTGSCKITKADSSEAAFDEEEHLGQIVESSQDAGTKPEHDQFNEENETSPLQLPRGYQSFDNEKMETGMNVTESTSPMPAVQTDLSHQQELNTSMMLDANISSENAEQSTSATLDSESPQKKAIKVTIRKKSTKKKVVKRAMKVDPEITITDQETLRAVEDASIDIDDDRMDPADQPIVMTSTHPDTNADETVDKGASELATLQLEARVGEQNKNAEEQPYTENDAVSQNVPKLMKKKTIKKKKAKTDSKEKPPKKVIKRKVNDTSEKASLTQVSSNTESSSVYQVQDQPVSEIDNVLDQTSTSEHVDCVSEKESFTAKSQDTSNANSVLEDELVGSLISKSNDEHFGRDMQSFSESSDPQKETFVQSVVEPSISVQNDDQEPIYAENESEAGNIYSKLSQNDVQDEILNFNQAVSLEVVDVTEHEHISSTGDATSHLGIGAIDSMTAESILESSQDQEPLSAEADSACKKETAESFTIESTTKEDEYTNQSQIDEQEKLVDNNENFDQLADQMSEASSIDHVQSPISETVHAVGSKVSVGQEPESKCGEIPLEHSMAGQLMNESLYQLSKTDDNSLSEAIDSVPRNETFHSTVTESTSTTSELEISHNAQVTMKDMSADENLKPKSDYALKADDQSIVSIVGELELEPAVSKECTSSSGQDHWELEKENVISLAVTSINQSVTANQSVSSVVDSSVIALDEEIEDGDQQKVSTDHMQTDEHKSEDKLHILEALDVESEDQIANTQTAGISDKFMGLESQSMSVAGPVVLENVIKSLAGEPEILDKTMPIQDVSGSVGMSTSEVVGADTSASPDSPLDRERSKSVESTAQDTNEARPSVMISLSEPGKVKKKIFGGHMYVKKTRRSRKRSAVEKRVISVTDSPDRMQHLSSDEYVSNDSMFESSDDDHAHKVPSSEQQHESFHPSPDVMHNLTNVTNEPTGDKKQIIGSTEDVHDTTNSTHKQTINLHDLQNEAHDLTTETEPLVGVNEVVDGAKYQEETLHGKILTDTGISDTPFGDSRELAVASDAKAKKILVRKTTRKKKKDDTGDGETEGKLNKKKIIRKIQSKVDEHTSPQEALEPYHTEDEQKQTDSTSFDLTATIDEIHEAQYESSAMKSEFPLEMTLNTDKDEHELKQDNEPGCEANHREEMEKHESEASLSTEVPQQDGNIPTGITRKVAKKTVRKKKGQGDTSSKKSIKKVIKKLQPKVGVVGQQTKDEDISEPFDSRSIVNEKDIESTGQGQEYDTPDVPMQETLKNALESESSSPKSPSENYSNISQSDIIESKISLDSTVSQNNPIFLEQSELSNESISGTNTTVENVLSDTQHKPQALEVTTEHIENNVSGDTEVAVTEDVNPAQTSVIEMRESIPGKMDNINDDEADVETSMADAGIDVSNKAPEMLSKASPADTSTGIISDELVAEESSIPDETLFQPSQDSLMDRVSNDNQISASAKTEAIANETAVSGEAPNEDDADVFMDAVSDENAVSVDVISSIPAVEDKSFAIKSISTDTTLSMNDSDGFLDSVYENPVSVNVISGDHTIKNEIIPIESAVTDETVDEDDPYLLMDATADKNAVPVDAISDDLKIQQSSAIESLINDEKQYENDPNVFMDAVADAIPVSVDTLTDVGSQLSLVNADPTQTRSNSDAIVTSLPPAMSTSSTHHLAETNDDATEEVDSKDVDSPVKKSIKKVIKMKKPRIEVVEDGGTATSQTKSIRKKVIRKKKDQTQTDKAHTEPLNIVKEESADNADISVLEDSIEQVEDVYPAATAATELVLQENIPSIATKPKVIKRVKKQSKKPQSLEGDEGKDESSKKPTVRRKAIKKVQKPQQSSTGDQT